MAGGFSDKLSFVPIFTRELARGINRAPSTRGIFVVPVNLANLRSDRKELLAIGDGFKPRSRPSIDLFVVTIWDRHVHAGVPIGSGTKNQTFLAQPESPGVVIAGTNELEFGTVRFEAINALAKPDFLAS